MDKWDVATVVFGVFLAFMLGEAIVRLFFPQSENMFMPEKDIGSIHVPNGTFLQVSPGEFIQTVKINSEGWYDVDHSIEKPAGVFRILVIGDSFTEAAQVNINQTYWKILENRLNETHPTEVISMGISGAGPGIEYLILGKYGLKYKPDMVILQIYPENDVKDDSEILSNGAANHPYLSFGENCDGKIVPVVTLPVTQKSNPILLILRNSKLYSFIETDVRTYLRHAQNLDNGVPVEYFAYSQNQLEVWKQSWHTTLMTISAIKQLADENNASFLVVIGTSKIQLSDNVWNAMQKQYPALQKIDLPQERFITYFDANNISYVNLLPVFREKTQEGQVLQFPINGHWTADGHEVVAEEIYNKIQRPLHPVGLVSPKILKPLLSCPASYNKLQCYKLPNEAVYPLCMSYDESTFSNISIIIDVVKGLNIKSTEDNTTFKDAIEVNCSDYFVVQR